MTREVAHFIGHLQVNFQWNCASASVTSSYFMRFESSLCKDSGERVSRSQVTFTFQANMLSYLILVVQSY